MIASRFSATRRTAADRVAARALRFVAAGPALILFLLLLALAGAMAAEPNACTGTNLVETLKAGGDYAAVEAKAARTANGDGKFYRVQKAGVTPSYLFGTMHLTDPRVVTLPAAADEAFEASDTLVIETTDVTDPKKAAGAFFANPALVNLPNGQTLGDILDDDQKKTVEKALSQRGVPFQAIRTLQPWFTSLSLMLPTCETARKAGGLAVLDVSLAARARAANKPVKGLESAKEQLEALASLPLDLQVESLMTTLELRDRMPDILETMLALYVEGKIATIMPAIEAAVPNGGVLVGQGEGYSQFEKTVVTDRNATMASRLQSMLEKGAAFVAIGALHLPGEDGLVEKLRTDGWTVTKLD